MGEYLRDERREGGFAMIAVVLGIGVLVFLVAVLFQQATTVAPTRRLVRLTQLPPATTVALARRLVPYPLPLLATTAALVHPRMHLTPLLPATSAALARHQVLPECSRHATAPPVVETPGRRPKQTAA